MFGGGQALGLESESPLAMPAESEGYCFTAGLVIVVGLIAAAGLVTTSARSSPLASFLPLAWAPLAIQPCAFGIPARSQPSDSVVGTRHRSARRIVVST